MAAVVVAATRVNLIHHGRHLRRDRGRIGAIGQADVLVRGPIRRALQVQRKVELETRVGRRIGHDGAYRHGRSAHRQRLADGIGRAKVSLRRGLRQDGRARVAKGLHEAPRERPLLGGIVRVVTEALEADVRVLAGAVLAQDAVDAIGAVLVRIPAELVLQEDGDEGTADEPDGEAHGIYGRVAGAAAKRAERETNEGAEHGAW
jgi:hypothetical protein